jgi:hypothetical protein
MQLEVINEMWKLQEWTVLYLGDFHAEFGKVHTPRIQNHTWNKELIFETGFYSLISVAKEQRKIIFVI